MEEKKLALAALEGAAADHFDGTGAVMNTAVSFSDDDDDDSDEFGEGNEFIDGGSWCGVVQCGVVWCGVAKRGGVGWGGLGWVGVILLDRHGGDVMTI